MVKRGLLVGLRPLLNFLYPFARGGFMMAHEQRLRVFVCVEM